MPIHFMLFLTLAVIIYVLRGLSASTALTLNYAAKLLAVTSVFAHPADRPFFFHGPDVLKGWDMFNIDGSSRELQRDILSSAKWCIYRSSPILPDVHIRVFNSFKSSDPYTTVRYVRKPTLCAARGKSLDSNSDWLLNPPGFKEDKKRK
ncbi:hypothetical protein LXA43DRAFT_1123296 [Ganoderma leucocontextum]|nr:hypothetical protein LXA43DRAFT_1123296 [Ganoderma leucocontextum]